MNRNKPPDDFDSSESENGIPQRNDDSQDERRDIPLRNVFDQTSEGNNDNGVDAEDIIDSGSGLPKNWKVEYIPTEIDFNNAGARRLRELKIQLNSANDPNKILQLLETINEIIRATQWLPSLVPDVLELGLAVRSPAQKIGRLDIWEETTLLLFQSLLEQLKSNKERNDYFHLILKDIADLKANIGQKMSERSAISELAREYGMYESGHGRWLLVRAALLNAVILDYTPEKADYLSAKLIQLARRSNDLATEMRVYLAKSRRAIQDYHHREVFTTGQQALAIATQIEAERFYSDCLSNMLVSALAIFPTPYVENLFDYWLKLRPALYENVYEKAMFFTLRGKYFYDRKADFASAAQAFQNAYEAELTQGKAIAQGTNLLGCGMSMTKLEQYDTAQEIYNQALTIFEKAHDDEMAIWVLHALGWNEKLRGQLKAGIIYLEDALSRSEGLTPTPRLESTCKGIKEDLAAYRSSLNGSE